MQWSSHSSSLASGELPEDDVDQLFEKLEPLAVPESIVQQVLARVKELTVAPHYQSRGAETDGTLFHVPHGASGLSF